MTQDQTGKLSRTASDEIAANVRYARKRQRWSAADLAARTGGQMSASVIQNIEHGRPRNGKRTRLVTVEELLVLSKALGRSPAALCPELAQLPGGVNLKPLADQMMEMFEELDETKRHYEQLLHAQVLKDGDGS